MAIPLALEDHREDQGVFCFGQIDGYICGVSLAIVEGNFKGHGGRDLGHGIGALIPGAVGEEHHLFIFTRPHGFKFQPHVAIGAVPGWGFGLPEDEAIAVYINIFILII